MRKGDEAGCTGPGCPSKDVNFYRVRWGAISGSLWPVCCWQTVRVKGRSREIRWEAVVTVQVRDGDNLDL